MLSTHHHLTTAVLILTATTAARAWTPPLNLTRGAADATGAAITVDMSGHVHLVVSRAGQTLWHLWYAEQMQTAWEQMILGPGVVSPALCTDSLNHTFLFHSRDFEIHYRGWDGVWTAETQISGDVGDANHPHACVDAQDNLHVVWSAHGQVWYNRRSGATLLWSGAQPIPGTSDLAGYFPPRVAVIGTAPVVLYGKNNGGSWSAWVASRETGEWVNTVLQDGGGASNGDISIDSDGNILAAWDADYDIVVQRRSGGVWSETFTRTGPALSLRPRVAAVNSNLADVLWREDGSIWGTRWNGSAWSTPEIVAPNTSGTGLELTKDTSGRRYASWSHDWDIWLMADQPLTDPIPPKPNALTAASFGPGSVTLSWDNPKAYDLSHVRIVHRTDVPPAGPEDGELILDRPAEWGADGFTHAPAANGITHYYGVYVTDTGGKTSPLAIASAMPTLRPDLDKDGDVDQSDFGRLQACITGPGVPQFQPECIVARLDADNDVDAADLDILLRCLSGSNVLPPDDCAD